MQIEDERISLFCSGPAGCAFMLIVEQNELSPESAVTPDVAYTVAALAIDAVRKWQGDYDEVVAHVRAHGPRLDHLARLLLSQPGAGWWFAPVDRMAQMWIGDHGRPLDLDAIVLPIEAPTVLERHAQSALGGLRTATVVGQVTAKLISLREGMGDYASQPPYTRYLLHAAATARVFEVNGPADWHSLCTTFPVVEPNGQLVPDWSAVARGWDAVHLTLGGLLTAQQVQVREGQYWTEQDGWYSEQTLWLRDQFEYVERWPDLIDIPPAPIDIAPWWYWGPTWNDDPKPWRTQLWAIEVDPGEGGTDV